MHSVTWWLNEIYAARKREKDFRNDGERILDIYSGKKAETTPFNILYSNTETLLPAIYSAVPRPVVQRRFKDEDPLGKAAATAGQRVLEFLLDTNVDGYETFDEAMRASVLDGLLPGRGVTCVKYDAETTDEAKTSELVCTETRSWNRVYFGYARKWSKVPWIAYEEHIDEKEAERLFGELAKKLTFTEHEGEEKDKDLDSERHTTCVYQIWDKDGGRKVLYVSAQYKDGVLREDDDPLELTGFFSCPRPIQFLEKSNDLLPVALYRLYENQAEELNRLTTRINRIVSAIKARGVYDSELGEDIGNIMSADENALIPADKSSSLAAEKGLQNAIWFMPIEQLITVLMQLYQAREQCKTTIYEITGIADIMRGSSAASETLGAQEIKQHWGTLRLKRLQKEVQRYARDILRMMLEVAATKFSPETFARMTGLPFVTGQQKQSAMQVAQAAQMSGQQVDPQTQAALQSPSWDDVLGMLRNDTQRAYRIDIETNSTVEPEAVEDQKNIAELMSALGQYLNGVTPLVTSGSLPFEAASAMLLAIVRRFRFGPDLEDIIKAMKPPEKDDGEAQKAQQQIQELTAQVQQLESDQQIEMQKLQLESEVKKAEFGLKQAEFEQNTQLRGAELSQQAQLSQAELAQKAELASAELMLKQQVAQAELQIKKQSASGDTQSRERIEFAKLGIKTEEEMAEPGALQTMMETIRNSNPTAEITQMMQEMANQSAEMMAQNQQIQHQQAQVLLQGLQMIVEQLSRPKRLIRDSEGRPTGVETL